MIKTPIHLWIVGVVSLLWNAGGAMDYLMTKLGDADYLAAVPEARLTMLEQAPLWFDFTWGLGVWLSIVGSLLLLLRSRFAGAAFALSLLGLLGSSIYTFILSDDAGMLAVAGTTAIVFTIAIPIILVALWLYARAMTRQGVLR